MAEGPLSHEPLNKTIGGTQARPGNCQNNGHRYSAACFITTDDLSLRQAFREKTTAITPISISCTVARKNALVDIEVIRYTHSCTMGTPVTSCSKLCTARKASAIGTHRQSPYHFTPALQRESRNAHSCMFSHK